MFGVHQTWEALVAMGGYGDFVWACYGLALLTFVGIFHFVNRSQCLAKKQLKQLEHHEA